MLLLPLLWACTQAPEDTGNVDVRGDSPAATHGGPALVRLTDSQYRNTVADLFGDDIALPSNLEGVDDVDGFQSIGAGLSTISPLGVERYETAAYQIASQVLADPTKKSAILSCDLTVAECVSEALQTQGTRIWRRPLSSEELARIESVVEQAADTLGDAEEGFEFGLAALLMSPHFLYRPEIGGEGSLSDFELASKLSYFLWDTMPDETLLALADEGALSDLEEYQAQVDRLMLDPRFQQGVDAFFVDLFDFDKLDEISKDPLIYKHMSADLPGAAREETLGVIRRIVLDENADYRTLFTTRKTWIDRRLAAIYDVEAPSFDGFGWVELPETAGRRGFLGHASFLTLNAHAVSSSVTLRGVFIREKVLCHSIPPPPADVNTSIPESTEELRTMRERVQKHLSDPSCAACHEITDLIGLGLENFDGIARWRTSENGAEIDPSGDLDGEEFSTAWDLSALLALHRDLGPCLSDNLFGHANHRVPVWEDREVMDWHSDGFSQSGYRIQALIRDVVSHSSFRGVGALEEESDE